ncbi:amidohydrolase [Streptomyces durmitorensis]|uniref:Amidohydrolase n=1 Tax=Streptomyces durmitorensis TaxID=319947 RepID=A0ABY4Q4P4_9ACTN|nr:amidohydrolase [Streptomyces durmitorensis]UQT60141.1 amidohydrolase [Streptomyces durmitorensis]
MPPAATTAASLALDVTSGLKTRDLEDLYQDLHRHPELSFQEHRTAGLLAERLRSAGFAVTTGVGGTGVVGVLHNGDGPVVWLRGDMDALPVTETTGLAYASTVDGVMHACGHDMHVTWLTFAAEALAAARETWSGTLVVIGQPAEEAGGGARAMVADGLHERFPRPDAVFGQHVAPGPAGLVAHTPGLIMSAADDLHIVVPGVGGHGSRPEATVDPVVTAAYIVTRLQTVVSREVAASDAVVLTTGQFHAGQRPNIIPSEARLGLNLRTQDVNVRERVLSAVRRIVEGECQAAGCPAPPEVSIGASFPATVNDADLDAEIAALHRELFGAGSVIDFGPAMGSEDFSLLVPTGVPYDFWFVPSTPKDAWQAAAGQELSQKITAVPANHSPLFAPDLSVLLPGVRTLVGAALHKLAA